MLLLKNKVQLIFDKRMEKVLVELDVSKGLQANIDIIYNDYGITQRLDYQSMSFRCSYCHETSHLRNT